MSEGEAVKNVLFSRLGVNGAVSVWPLDCEMSYSFEASGFLETGVWPEGQVESGPSACLSVSLSAVLVRRLPSRHRS